MTLHLFLSPGNEMHQVKVIGKARSVEAERTCFSPPWRRRYLGGM